MGYGYFGQHMTAPKIMIREPGSGKAVNISKTNMISTGFGENLDYFAQYCCQE
jgi:hypothetical protein